MVLKSCGKVIEPQLQFLQSSLYSQHTLISTNITRQTNFETEYSVSATFFISLLYSRFPVFASIPELAVFKLLNYKMFFFFLHEPEYICCGCTEGY